MTEPRTVSVPLMTGLVTAPLLFVWLLLRRGYPPSLRRVAFAYALAPPALGIVARTLDAFF